MMIGRIAVSPFDHYRMLELSSKHAGTQCQTIEISRNDHESGQSFVGPVMVVDEAMVVPIDTAKFQVVKSNTVETRVCHA